MTFQAHLEERAEIYDVLMRYCRGIDRLDEELVRSCYHPDAVDNHGLYDGSVDYFVSRAFTRQRTIEVASHALHNVRIEFAGDAAVCESYGTAVERSRLEDGTLLDQINGFRYIDRFERRDGSWLIARRTVVMDWARSEPVDEGWVADAGFVRGRRDGSDPVYQELELLARRD